MIINRLMVDYNRLIILAAFCFQLSHGFGQSVESGTENGNKFSLSYRQQFGSLFQTNDFVKGDNATGQPLKRFSASLFEYTTQSNGDNYYRRVNNYPYYGYGIGKFYFPNTDEIGNPWVIYTHWGAPIKRFKRVSFFYEVDFGVSFGWNEYDQEFNEFNVAIGSNATMFISTKLRSSFQLSPSLSLDLSVLPNHFSNGAVKWPNYGLEMLGYEFGLTYSFYDRLAMEFPVVVEEFHPVNEYSFALAYASVMVDEDIDENPIYPLRAKGQVRIASVYVFTFLAQRHLYPAFKTGFGVDLSIDNSAVIVNTSQGFDVMKAPTKDRTSLGMMWGFEYMFGNLSLIAHLVYDVVSVKRPFHQKAGGRFRITDNLFVGTAVKAHSFEHAEFMEWSVGYRFPAFEIKRP